MGNNFEILQIEPNSSRLLNEAWLLKEEIRRGEDLLKQKWGFFAQMYHEAEKFWCVDSETGGGLGFIAVQDSGYIFFIAVNGNHRKEGIGKYLIDLLGEKYDHISCHVRTTNIGAIGFYEKIGFEKEKLVQRYYEDMGDAWYLVYSPNL
ncbi:MAG TPA: GNAT family N-acetyltransferase [Halobacteriales archaeon]|uniref:GNAT family N-acetyltransferase n=1 Tax=Candidatus Hikarchaeum yamanae TaxID=2675326 RepID=UPI00180B04EF|nr:GNAT family N-acetyltransferase [Halobacteriales archaeon]